MNTVFDVLFSKFKNMSLSSVEMSRLFINVRNIIEHDSIVTTNTVMRELKRLGWEDVVLDPNTLDLVVSVLEAMDLKEARGAVQH